MKIKGIKRIVLAALALISSNVSAENLAQIYQQALIFDPTFKQAQANWLTAKENFPLALTGNGSAGTGLFPNISFTGQLGNGWERVSNRLGSVAGNFPDNGYTVSLTQPILNVSTWISIASARYSVRAATAQYLAAAQDLMNRVAVAYFEVLRANDNLTLVLAQKAQFLNQLITSEEKFKVGLIAITGVYNAQASYDRSIADEIQTRNDLLDRLEDLRAITGKFYKSLARLKSKIPLLVPQPNRINAWVAIALKQNYTIQADWNNMLSSQQNVRLAATAQTPQLNATGTYSDLWAGGTLTPPLVGRLPMTRTQQSLVGLSLTFPVFRGGYDIANTKQARYQYLSASDQLQVDYATVEKNTRQAFLGIVSGISQIEADVEAIISARNQLEATQAGYIVGTRTMVDVLDAVTSLTQAQLAYANNRYNYVEGIFSLKDQAGTLAPQDIAEVNSWLGEPIHFSLTQPKVKIRPEPYGKYPPVNTHLLDINKPEYTDPLQPAQPLTFPPGNAGGGAAGPTPSLPASSSNPTASSAAQSSAPVQPSSSAEPELAKSAVVPPTTSTLPQKVVPAPTLPLPIPAPSSTVKPSAAPSKSTPPLPELPKPAATPAAN